MATVIIPTPLRKFTANTAKVKVNAQNVQAALNGIIAEFPELEKHLLDENGKVRTFVNVFVNDDDIRDLDQTDTAVEPESLISIVPAIAGGNH